MEIFNSVDFLGTAGPRVLFNIHVLYHSVDIQRFSACPTEHEIILLPGRYFEVKGILEQPGKHSFGFISFSSDKLVQLEFSRTFSVTFILLERKP